MALDDVLPRRNLPGAAEPWGRAVEGRMRELNSALTRVDRSAQAANRDMASTLDSLSSTVLRLADASRVYYADNGSDEWTLGSQTWTSSPDGPQVVASSMSGRFRVSVSVSASGGSAAGVFSTENFPRDRALGDSPDAARARVGAAGGVNAVFTGSASWIISLSPDTLYTFSAHGLNLNGTPEFPITIQNLSITVEPLF